MPRFFFDLRLEGDGLEQDDLGIDLPDFETAYLEAHRAAVDIWADARREGWKLGRATFEVRDALGRPVLELPFTEALKIGAEPLGSANRNSQARPSPIKADLDKGRAFFAAGGKCVLDQQRRVQRLEQRGCDATLAKAILATFIETQALRQRHGERLKGYLRQGHSAQFGV